MRAVDMWSSLMREFILIGIKLEYIIIIEGVIIVAKNRDV